MQESTLLQKWRKEGRKEGKDEGRLKAARADVLEVLETRFPGMPVPEGVRSALEKNIDVQQLRAWLRGAVLTASPADFERFLTAPRG